MAEVFNRQGIPASLVLNAIAKTPQAASSPLPGGPHLGLAAADLAIWRKLPFAMLAAAGEIPGAVVHVAGANDQVEEFARARIDTRIRRQPIPQNEMPKYLSQMHLNLYVTLSECCPMLPLESLAEGVPCLIGPNSHLFEDSPYLLDRLVVRYPDRNEVIAHYIRQARLSATISWRLTVAGRRNTAAQPGIGGGVFGRWGADAALPAAA